MHLFSKDERREAYASLYHERMSMKSTTPQSLIQHANKLVGFANTPADTCVVHDAGTPVRKALATINANTGDLLLAREMGCDTVLLHHPLAGAARRSFAGVLDRMVELMVESGCSVEAAQDAVESLRWKARFNDHASDWDLLASAAAHININLLNIHLAADEIGRREMLNATSHLTGSSTLQDAIDSLRTIPELSHQTNELITVPDDLSRQLGKLAIMHAGGTNGGLQVADALYGAGIGTVLYIHIDGASAHTIHQRAEEGSTANLIISGHFASDAIGMNILLASIQQSFGVEFIRHGGLLPYTPRSAPTMDV